jgi:hypothetical protein
MMISPEMEEHSHTVVVGLVQKAEAGDENTDLNTCLLGSFDAEYFMDPGADAGTGEPFHFSETFLVNDDCLPGSGDAGTTLTGTYNLWVGMNPALSPTGDELTDPENYNTQFFNAAKVDLEPGPNRNDLCYSDYSEMTGQGCIHGLVLTDSPGLDVDIVDFASESSVAVLHRDEVYGCYACSDGESTSESDCLAGGDDAGTNTWDMVAPDAGSYDAADCASNDGIWASTGAIDCSHDHGQPLLELDGTLIVYGHPHHDDETEGTVENNDAISGAHGDADHIRVTYELCPYGGQDSCAPGTDWSSLQIAGDADGTFACSDATHTTEQDCLAPGTCSDTQYTDEAACITATETWTAANNWGPREAELADYLQIDDLAAATPFEFHHKVFLEGGTDACTSTLGDWSQYGLFHVRVCTETTFDESGDHAHHDDNNCEMISVNIIRDTPVASTDASSYDLSRTWDTSTGNSVVGANAGVGTVNNVNLSGATTHNYGYANVTGWVGFSIFNIYADAAAYVSIVGSNYDAAISILGTTYWSASDEIAAYSNSWDYTYTKSYCYTYNYGIAGLGLNISLCASGSAGLTTTVDIEAVDIEPMEGSGGAPFADSTRIGNATITATPEASLSLSATASANLAVLRGGATGTLNLVVVSIPAVGNLRWGLIAGPSLVMVGNASLDLSLNFLSGSVSAYVEAWYPSWCGCGSWCPGYPCGNWGTIWSDNIATWSGFTYSYNLYSYNSGTITLF